MAKQSALFLHANHNPGTTTLVNSDGTTAKTVFTAGANDADLKMLVAVSDDTAAVKLGVYYHDGTTQRRIGTVNVPLLAGTDGATPTVNLLNTTDIPGLLLDPMLKPYLPVKAGHTVRVGANAAVTSAKTVTLSAFGHDF